MIKSRIWTVITALALLTPMLAACGGDLSRYYGTEGRITIR